MNKHTSDDPITLFQEWLDEAEKQEINDHAAMSLATCSKDGKPSIRMMLLKQADHNGFKFHTNQESQKGCELHKNPYAALCFYWKSLRKQVRIEGEVKIVTTQEAEEYFQNRPYERQVGAWASQQSRPLKSREYLEEKIKDFQIKYPKGSTIPCPEYWVGYRLVPNTIEFWWDNPDRLHDRLKYTKNNDGNWDITRLYP
ncbi:MAG: pyridoxamine 5'-phosphate oxidase [Zetaproteobacteria bacterium]|nr:MAG: pyridoxamine 5'-phosphate oxidase [Zetaproteobacteria bacterium]